MLSVVPCGVPDDSSAGRGREAALQPESLDRCVRDPIQVGLDDGKLPEWEHDWV